MKLATRKAVGPTDVVRIGTRPSELARRRAALVEAFLVAGGRQVEVVVIRTAGDKKRPDPASLTSEGIFTRELESALARGKVDCCVHALKDLPPADTPGLELAAVPERYDPRDALLLNPIASAAGLDDLSSGSRVGTSSARARAQLLALRPDLDVVELRGDVPTRLRKLDEGRLHGAILPAASLLLLGAQQRIREYLEPPEWLPAPAQGAVAVQVRSEDEAMRSLVAPMNHEPTVAAVRAERAFLSAMEGGYGVPLGALVVGGNDGFSLHAFISDLGGRNVIRASASVDPDMPERSGELLAREIRDRGGESVLAELRGASPGYAPQPE